MLAEQLRDQLVNEMAESMDVCLDQYFEALELKECEPDWDFSKEPDTIRLKTDKGVFAIKVSVEHEGGETASTS